MVVVIITCYLATLFVFQTFIMGKTRKGLKDPLAPKKPLSSYMEFVKEERPKMICELGPLSLGDSGKELGRRWQVLSKELREEYEVRSKENRVKYAREMKLGKFSPGGPKKPLSPYIEFAQVERIKIQTELGSLSIVEMGKELGKRWQNLPKEQKVVFQDRNKENQKKYISEMKEFLKKTAAESVVVPGQVSQQSIGISEDQSENDSATINLESPTTVSLETSPTVSPPSSKTVERTIVAADLGFAKQKGYSWHPAIKTGELARGNRIMVTYFGTAQTGTVDKDKWLAFSEDVQARVTTPRLLMNAGFKKGLDQLKIMLNKINSSGEKVTSSNSGVGFTAQPVGRKLVKLSQEGLQKDEEQNFRFMKEKIVATDEVPFKWRCLDCPWKGKFQHKAKSHARDCGSRKKDIVKKSTVKKYECSAGGCFLAFPLLSQLQAHYR